LRGFDLLDLEAELLAQLVGADLTGDGLGLAELLVGEFDEVLGGLDEGAVDDLAVGRHGAPHFFLEVEERLRSAASRARSAAMDSETERPAVPGYLDRRRALPMAA
jgi:hypothetical protein